MALEEIAGQNARIVLGRCLSLLCRAAAIKSNKPLIMPIPRILFVTCMPLEKPRTASMVVMSMLLQQYSDNFVWFALRPPAMGMENPYSIPYGSAKRLNRPSRFPILKQYLKLGPWARYQGHQAAAFGRSQNIDVILADLAFEAVVAGRVAAQILDVPLLVSVHDDPVNRIAVKGYPNWLIRLYARDFAGTMKAAIRCGVISPYMGEVYQERYGVETTTLYSGVQADNCLTVRNLNQNKRPILIGSVGSVHSADNWDLLIDAVQRLNEQNQQEKYRVLHIGKLADNLQRSSEVEITGWVPEEEFLIHLGRIDIGFLNWSFDPDYTTTRRTSFPLKVSSYIQAQVPMISLGPPDSSIIRFVEDYHCGATCREPDAGLLASSLEEIAANREIYEEALQGVRHLKQIFSRERFFQNFEAFVRIP